MSDTSLRTVLVKFSITNPDEVDYRDTVAPLSFLDFINNTQADYSPEEYSSFYSSYLASWHAKQGGSEEEQKTQFKDFYRQFIKEIVINYTTETEKRFLEKIDFNDPADLDVAIPFFANRLKDIALFYKKKRDEGKYVIELALAGYKKDEVSVEVKDGVLIIEGKSKEDLSNYVHQGIAKRSFKRQFQLADYVECKGGKLADGMLNVELEYNPPESKKSKQIKID